MSGAKLTKFRLFALTLFVLTGVVAACSGASIPVTFEDRVIDSARIEQGQQLYAQYCAACHGVNGEGQFPNTPLEPDPTGRYGAPPHNESGHTWHHDDALLFRYVREGGMGDPSAFYPMPAFGEQLSDEQIVSILAYIKSLWTNDQRVYQQQRTEAANEG
jgi:mono/diheme cytochrome c family protein